MYISRFFCIALTLGTISCDRASFQTINEESTGLDSTPLDQQSQDQIRELENTTSLETLPSEPNINCANGESSRTVTFALTFNERKNCAFGAGQNLSELAGFMQAAETQTISVDLSNLREVCELNLRSQSADLHYDDYLFLTLNNLVLVSSEFGWVHKLESVNNLHQWDWMKLRGQDHRDVEGGPNYGVPYCFSDPACMVPGHDQIGSFQYHLNNNAITQLESSSLDVKTLEFQMIATGDNDSDDCDHSSFDLLLEVSYLE